MEGEVGMDRQRLERCLETVAAYRSSGMKAKVWAQANGVALLELQSWCAHARRWRARLDEADGVGPVRPAGAGGSAERLGFVAARLPGSAMLAPAACASSVRLELGAGAGRVELHWPLTHVAALGPWLREYTRGTRSDAA